MSCLCAWIRLYLVGIWNFVCIFLRLNNSETNQLKEYLFHRESWWWCHHKLSNARNFKMIIITSYFLSNLKLSRYCKYNTKLIVKNSIIQNNVRRILVDTWIKLVSLFHYAHFALCSTLSKSDMYAPTGSCLMTPPRVSGSRWIAIESYVSPTWVLESRRDWGW